MKSEMAPLGLPRQTEPAASDRAVHPAASASRALGRDKEPGIVVDTTAEAVSTAIPGRNRTCCPSCSLGSAGGLHGCHFGREIILFYFDALTKGVTGKTTNLDVLTDLAGCLFHKISHGD